MENQSPTQDMQFVNATVDNPTAPRDPAVRAVIRKQAMKIAADTRRRGGSYGKHNLRQYPVFCPDSRDGAAAGEASNRERPYKQGASTESLPPQDDQEHLRKQGETESAMVSMRSIASTPSATGFELVMMKNGIDLIDLSAWANHHVGQATTEALSSDPLQLLKLLDFKQWSYMPYLPSLYGSSLCLDHAIDCIVARVRHIIAPTGEAGERSVIRLYLKSINSLQTALNCPTQGLTADVLCATEILALYELLDPSGVERWMRHASGATKLIRLRGPETYNTEFEKALFIAHSGFIMTESLLNNDKCFLAQPAWQAVFQSVIIPGPDEFSARSEPVVTLLILKSRVSALFAEITGQICNPQVHETSQLNPLASQASSLRTDLLQWRSINGHLFGLTPDKRCETMSHYIICSMISSRLLTAICFRLSESAGLEEEAQRMASQILEINNSVGNVCPHRKFFIAETVRVAQATIATADDWMTDASRNEGGNTIEKWKFERWCGLFGRKVS